MGQLEYAYSDDGQSCEHQADHIVRMLEHGVVRFGNDVSETKEIADRQFRLAHVRTSRNTEHGFLQSCTHACKLVHLSLQSHFASA